MASSSSLTEQLAILGIHLPGWPEEPEDGSATGDWILRGLSYAEGIRLLRAQLRSAAVSDIAGGKRLTGVMQNLRRRSAWDQAVVCYLLADLQEAATFERVHAAAKLVAKDTRTYAQRLGAALTVARDGMLWSAVNAIQQLVNAKQMSCKECFELCALLIANFPASKSSGAPDADDEGELWLRNVALHQQASTVLAMAANATSGELDLGALANKLESLAALAIDSRHGAEHDERAAIGEIKTRERRLQTRSQNQPLLRTIHQMACTGGTVISKCLAVMPDVALISEVNPMNRSGSRFEPNNPLLLLERSYRQLSNTEIIEEFMRQIGFIHQICLNDDVDLVIRDHSHTDFCIGAEPLTGCSIVDHLGGDYEILSVVTVRHPLDSYLGLLANGWHNHFTPSNLNEYCRRYLAFLDRYSALPMRRYEDFCAQPEDFMQDICDILQVSYTESFISRFGAIALTGDSGRKGIESIEPRPRREVPDFVQVEVGDSDFYGELVERLGYQEA